MSRRAQYRRLLVPTDGSPLALKGARAAVGLARALGAGVHAMHATPTPAALLYGAADAYAAPLLIERLSRGNERQARKALAAVERLARDAGVRCTAESVQGDLPWRAIIAVARKRKCDLVVMASHGRGALGGLLLGSETSRVLSHAKIPVLVVR